MFNASIFMSNRHAVTSVPATPVCGAKNADLDHLFFRHPKTGRVEHVHDDVFDAMFDEDEIEYKDLHCLMHDSIQEASDDKCFYHHCCCTELAQTLTAGEAQTIASIDIKPKAVLLTFNTSVDAHAHWEQTQPKRLGIRQLIHLMHLHGAEAAWQHAQEPMPSTTTPPDTQQTTQWWVLWPTLSDYRHGMLNLQQDPAFHYAGLETTLTWSSIKKHVRHGATSKQLPCHIHDDSLPKAQQKQTHWAHINCAHFTEQNKNVLNTLKQALGVKIWPKQ